MRLSFKPNVAKHETCERFLNVHESKQRGKKLAAPVSCVTVCALKLLNK